MNAKTEKKAAARALPAELADVALIDASACAAVGGMSVSWWHAEVAAGRAPQPVIREPRCTRWRSSDVRAYWAKRAEEGTANVQAAAAVVAKAKKASVAAQAKRAAAAAAASAAA